MTEIQYPSCGHDSVLSNATIKSLQFNLLNHFAEPSFAQHMQTPASLGITRCFDRLHTFHRMPGNVVMLEACFRDARFFRATGLFHGAAVQISTSMFSPLCQEHTGAVPDYVSLAATMRKVSLAGDLLVVGCSSGRDDDTQLERGLGSEHKLHYPNLIPYHALIISLDNFKAGHTHKPAVPACQDLVDTLDPLVCVPGSSMKHTAHQLQSIMLCSLVGMCGHQVQE